MDSLSCIYHELLPPPVDKENVNDSTFLLPDVDNDLLFMLLSGRMDQMDSLAASQCPGYWTFLNKTESNKSSWYEPGPYTKAKVVVVASLSSSSGVAVVVVAVSSVGVASFVSSCLVSSSS